MSQADTKQAETQSAEIFGVYAEVSGTDRPLIITGLTFARLVDDIVIPHEEGKSFFIDGVAVKRGDNLRRIKIIQLRPFFQTVFHDLHHGLRWGNLDRQKLYASQYHVRLEALLRENGEDVTSQVIKAYQQTIATRLKEYVGKRPELIAAAFGAFVQSIKFLSGH